MKDSNVSLLCFNSVLGCFCHTRSNLGISPLLEILQVGPRSGMILQQEPPTHCRVENCQTPDLGLGLRGVPKKKRLGVCLIYQQSSIGFLNRFFS